MLRAVPGTGLGILRSDQDMSPSFGKLPPAVRAKAREKELLIITKANSRATVHRPVYLDYVGVKVFDASGEVTGERRFLGLFSSAAYTESLLRIPVLREKATQLLEGAGFTPMSHSGKELLDILENYPRDELFQTSVEELLPVTEAVLHLRERRQLRFFTRRDVYGRYLSCLVFLPRDRYTTQVRERMQDILKATMGADTIDYTARVSESVLARLHFVVRAAPGETLRDFDEVGPGAGARRGDPVVDRRPRRLAARAVRRGDGRPAGSDATARRFPRPTRRTSRQPSVLRTYGGWRRWTTARSCSRSTRPSAAPRGRPASRYSAPARR